MFVDAIKKIEKTMFPIFFVEEVGQGQTTLGICGTGFFINADGVFASVAHIFDSKSENKKYVFYGFLPDNVVNPYLEIHELCRDNEHDIFIGKIELKTPDFLEISEKMPDIGKTICIAGYPLAEITLNVSGGFELSGVRRYYQPSFVLDSTSVNTDNNNGVVRTHQGFLVRDFGLYGMSGGPVFDITGKIYGIQGSVTRPRISINGTDSISVQNAVAIKTDLILGLLTANNIG
jgi:hypothetical protein